MSVKFLLVVLGVVALFIEGFRGYFAFAPKNNFGWLGLGFIAAALYLA